MDFSILERSQIPTNFNKAVVYNANRWDKTGFRLITVDKWAEILAQLERLIERLPSMERKLERLAITQLKAFPERQSLLDSVKKYYSFDTQRTRPHFSGEVRDYLNWMREHQSRVVSNFSDQEPLLGNNGLPELSNKPEILQEKITNGQRVATMLKRGARYYWDSLNMRVVIKLGEEERFIYPWFVWSRLENKLRAVFGSDHSELGLAYVVDPLKRIIMGSQGWGGNPWELNPRAEYYWSGDFSRFDTTAYHLRKEITEALYLTNPDEEKPVIDFLIWLIFEGPVLFSGYEPTGEDGWKRVVILLPPQPHGLMSGSKATSTIGTFANSFTSFVALKEIEARRLMSLQKLKVKGREPSIITPYYMGDDKMLASDEPFDPMDFVKVDESFGFKVKKDEEDWAQLKLYGQFIRLFFYKTIYGLVARFFPTVRVLHSINFWEHNFILHSREDSPEAAQRRIDEFVTRTAGKLMNVLIDMNVSVAYMNYTKHVLKLARNLLVNVGVPGIMERIISAEYMDWWDFQRLRPKLLAKRDLTIKDIIDQEVQGP